MSAAAQTTSSSSLAAASIDTAVRTILDKNFDADSKVCVLTLLKIIDNVLQKPGNDKVRNLRTGNATIRSKILENHGHHLLLACGFSHEPADPKWKTEERLVLKSEHEDTTLLVRARHTLARIGTLELGLKDVPAFVSPPASVMPSAANQTTTIHTGFDVYQGNRFDGQSASVGTNLGAPEGWKSKTEQELEALQKREAKLQRQMAKQPAATLGKIKKSASAPPTVDRQWTVFLPGQSHSQLSSSQQAIVSSVASSVTSSSRGDSALLASHIQKQHAQRKTADNRGFTTKAMRDLEKLKKTKVYSHTQLAIHFPDGISVRANFATREPLRAVLEGLAREVLFSTATLPLPDMELYQTPPRRVLDPSKTLRDQGLVPAAKVYISWKSPLPKMGDLDAGWYIQQELLSRSVGGNSSVGTTGPALATSVSVLHSETAKSKAASSSTDATAAKRKKTRAEKEAALMKRMLGK